MQVSVKSGLAKAIKYALGHWKALTRYCDDGRIEIDNNTAERSIRPLAKGRSLCTSFRNLGKNWELSFNVATTRAMFARQRHRDSVTAQVGRANLPRRIRHHLLGGQDLVFDNATDCMAGDTQLLCSLGHRQPLPILLCRSIGMACHKQKRPSHNFCV